MDLNLNVRVIGDRVPGRFLQIGPVTDRPIPTRRKLPVGLSITDSQQSVAHASALDEAGNAVPDPNPIAWSVDDPTIAVLTPSTDTQTCTIASTGKVGACNVTMTDSVLNVSDTFAVTVGLGAPTSLSVTFDPPTDRINPPAPPAVTTPPSGP